MRRLRSLTPVVAGLGVVAAAVALLALVMWPSSSTPPVGADLQGIPHMAIDADPGNGARPCDPIDATRSNAPSSGTYTVAICLVESFGAPDAFEATVLLSGGVAVAPEVADVGEALDDNPDFNEAPGPLGSGANWSCNGFGFSFPSGGAAHVHFNCNNASFVAGELTANPGLLGTIAMQANGTGAETFAFTADGSSSVNSPAGANKLCGVARCPGAVVGQGIGVPTNTPEPPNPPSPTDTPTRPAIGAGLGDPHMAIDADPGNGVRPCDPIDATRSNAPASGTYTVALCLVESAGAPDGFEATVQFSGGIASAPEIADAGDGLDDNPDFNQNPGPYGSGANWSCNAFELSYPHGGATDARIVCNDKVFAAGDLTASPGLLATITMLANGTGAETFTFSTDGSSSVNSPAGTNHLCEVAGCPGAVVGQAIGVPTNTPGPTNTPSPTGTVTDTPTATRTPTVTPTPCAPNCPTATPTPTPVGAYPPPTGNCVLASSRTTALTGTVVDLTVRVRDEGGVPVPRAWVDISIESLPSGSNASLHVPGPAADANGTFAATLDVGSVAGTVVLQAISGTVSCGASVIVE